MTINIMLDLETWGTEPGCDIRSIGACVFDPVTGYVGGFGEIVNTQHTFYIACDNPNTGGKDPMKVPIPHILDNGEAVYSHDHNKPYEPIYHHDGVDTWRKYRLKRDPRTVQWWSEQSDEAQAAFANPVDLREGLGKFTQWLMSVAPACGPSIAYDIRLWSHGASFDPPILAAAYKAVGLPVPWHYRAPRDTRTLFDVAGIADHSAWLKQHPGPLGIPHHALDDSICQARAVCATTGMIQGWYAGAEYLNRMKGGSQEHGPFGTMDDSL